MKKIITLISILLVSLLVTGCGGSASSGTIICTSEAHGENPSIIYYEKYVVKDNKVTDYIKYNTYDYTDEYLKKVSIDTIYGVYSADKTTKVEKVDANTIKTTYIEPTNFYKDIESDNMIETIRASLEDNTFNIYNYTCEIE